MSASSVSIREIVDYWSRRESECGLGIDWAEAHERRWRCGYRSALQRCHVIPSALGGPDDPSNLVLLCGRCHREAPNVQDPRFVWIWLRATCVPFYDLYWTVRGAQEFEKMFQRRPFSGPEFEGIDRDQVKQLLGKEMEKATIHFGEGRLNPATIVCIFARIEERLTGKPVTAPTVSSNSRFFFELVGWAKKDEKGEGRGAP
jgi:hypothetical protein